MEACAASLQVSSSRSREVSEVVVAVERSAAQQGQGVFQRAWEGWRASPRREAAPNYFKSR